MPEALQISDSADARQTQRGRSLRDTVTRAYDAVMAPLQAGTIAAGAAADSGMNQLRRNFQRGAGAVAGMVGNQAEAERMRMLAEQTNQQIQDAGALYQPLREQYPLATAIGEAVPAAVPAGLAGFRAQAGLNLGREGLDAMARAVNSQRLRALAMALRRF